MPVSKEDGKQDANKALEGLKTLGTLLITNGEFRKLCEFYQSVICIARAHALQ